MVNAELIEINLLTFRVLVMPAAVKQRLSVRHGPETIGVC